MKFQIRNIFLCLLVLAGSAVAAPDFQLYVDGVLYRAPSVLEKGLPYFPVDVLSQATGVSVVSFNDTAVRLAGSPVDFVPVVRDGRPYLPAEAFALATGSSVERDQTRGLVLYSKNIAGTTSAPPAAVKDAPSRANEGVTADDPGPAPPVAAPPTAVGSPNTEGLQEAVIGALKTAEQATYAERYMRHKLYWASQLDPANSPYLKVTPPPGGFPYP